MVFSIKEFHVWLLKYLGIPLRKGWEESNDLFYTQDNKIAVYHMAGADAERYQEGWYLEEKEDVYQSIAADEEGQKTLIEALQEKGVDFTPYHEKICEYEKTLDLLLDRKKEQRTGNM